MTIKFESPELSSLFRFCFFISSILGVSRLMDTFVAMADMEGFGLEVHISICIITVQVSIGATQFIFQERIIFYPNDINGHR